MKILVISQMFPCKRHPTSAIFFANLMKQLAPKVNELVVVTPRVYIPRPLTKLRKRWQRWYLDPMRSKENGLEIIRPFTLAFPGSVFAGINGLLMQSCSYRLVKNLIQNRKIDLILGYNMLPEGLAAVGLGGMFDLPSGFWAIGTDVNDDANHNRLNRYLSRVTIQNSQLILTESKNLESKIKILSRKFDRVQTFYKGIDVSNFRNLPPKSALIKKLNVRPDKRYLLFVGRLIHDKGIYELAHCFEVLAERYPDLDLIMIGEEIEREELLSKLARTKLVNRVLFKGILSHQEVACFMKISDVLIFPSWSEGLPNVVMEAMAAGLPVVASGVGGIPEILENGVNGLLVPPRNVQSLITATGRMLNDKKLSQDCIRNAKRLIRERFDVKKNVDELCTLLQQMRAGNSSFPRNEKR